MLIGFQLWGWVGSVDALKVLSTNTQASEVHLIKLKVAPQHMAGQTNRQSGITVLVLYPLHLSDLRLNDCRLLEKCSNKEESLKQLVAALKTVPSLHTLSLAQNRLGRHSN